ncbi:MAG TPA: hypothetical protein DHV36_21940, partial [Desulfobacteraceae bacterium]|nr:hypothetical protein [Desulfobacteraceae bacterium]
PLFGARPLKRVIQSRIQDFLADEIIQGNIVEESLVNIYLDEEEKIAFVTGDAPVPVFERAPKADPEAENEAAQEDEDVTEAEDSQFTADAPLAEDEEE